MTPSLDGALGSVQDGMYAEVEETNKAPGPNGSLWITQAHPDKA